jgi:hypothetical protein
VKISNITNGRSSALTPAVPAVRRRSSALCASDHATSIVIPLALSEFCEGPAQSDLAKGGRRLRPTPVKACLPQAGIPPSFSVPSAFLCVLCVKSCAFLCSFCLPKPQFPFDTNKPFAFTTNFSARRKQSTSFFLFNTNEQSPITAHQSLFSNFGELSSSAETPPSHPRPTRMSCGLTPPLPLRTMRRMLQKRRPGARAEI